jgi:2-haloacid dehalogenase
MSSAEVRTPAGGSAPQLPAVLLFDVSETLADLSSLGGRFAAVGADAGQARTWLATVLLDGMALTAARAEAHFHQLAEATLRAHLTGQRLSGPIDEAVTHILGGFDELAVQADVPLGLPALAALGPQLVTLGNIEADVAERLLARAGLAGVIDRHLSTDDAGMWKPAPAAYAYAAGRCRSRPAAMMLVSVQPWDINGAHLAGFRTAWINRAGAAYPPYFHPPTVEARSLTHLADLLSADQ